MKIQNIVVVGSDAASLLVALTLKRRIPPIEVRVIQQTQDNPLHATEGTTASLPGLLLDYLKLPPTQFYREVEPLWKLGTRFNWGNRGEFYYAFNREYEHSPAELSRGIGFYCTNGTSIVGPSSALMAQNKIFPRRSDGLPQVTRNFGFHVENSKLSRYLEDRCLDSGILIQRTPLNSIDRNADGTITIRLDSGEQVFADLFIDAGGFGSKRLGHTIEEPSISYRQTLFCDKVITGTQPRTVEAIRSYTTVDTMSAGWCWQFEQELQINRGYVYSSEFISDEAASEEFLAKHPQVAADSLQIYPLHQGRISRTWMHNVVSIGDASGYIEPLQSTRLHMICTQARLLSELVADSLCEPTSSLIELYNESVAKEWDDIRDFLAVHYAFNTRCDTPFWRANRENSDLDGACRIVRCYRENGPTFVGASNLMRSSHPFGLDGYFTLLVGQGVAHEKPYRPSAAEQHMWRKRLALLESQAARALTVKESLDALRAADWRGM